MNTQPADRAPHVVIAGGGITGLSAGWYLQQEAARRGISLDYNILEQSPRWGGKVRTEQVESPGHAPFILEAGADAFITRKPWALELARDLGLDERILPVSQTRTFVLHGGRPVPLPDGLQLLVPTRLMPFLRSPLFSLRGKLRTGLDWLIPPRRSDEDETLASFVRRRLGAEMLDRLAEPLLGGVYNGDPERQSIAATFPQFPALERQYGSLIRGMRATQPERSASPFISFETGAQEIVGALVTQLRGSLQLNTAVRCIERLPDQRYRVLTTSEGALEADAVILTTPAYVTAKLLHDLAPAAAQHLSAIRYAGIGTAYFAFRREHVPHPLDGAGVVIPGSERRRIDGVTWTSSKWSGRAPSGYALLRVFFGGPRTRDTLKLEEAELVAVVRDELQAIFGISAPPLFHRIYRWEDGYPQYDIGHLERVAAAERALPAGVVAAGSAYHGVGVPDCVRQGREAAEKVAAMVGERVGEGV